MKEILNAKFDNIGAKDFKLLGPLASLIADIILVFYVNTILLKNMITPQVLRLAISKSQNIPPNQISADYINMAYQAMVSSLGFAMWAIVLCNFVIYLFCLSKMTWARTYIKGYASSAVTLSVLELAVYLIKLHQVNFYTLGTMLLYFFTAYGYYHFRKTGEL